MAVNLNKPERWKDDTAQSVDFYNAWFMRFAPKTFRDARNEITQQVGQAIENTGDLTLLTPQMLREHPTALSMLRMSTAPPIARDRLSGLAYVKRSVINRMEKKGMLPTRMSEEELNNTLSRMCNVISELLDRDIFPWL